MTAAVSYAHDRTPHGQHHPHLKAQLAYGWVWGSRSLRAWVVWVRV